jgi:activator of HSP90 ATPase
LAHEKVVVRSVIRQSIVLPASSESLFDAYLDSAKHSAFTGFPVIIGGEAGSPFEAFAGQLSGTILAVARPRLIVQSWRSTKFNAGDPDSILILAFTPDVSNFEHGRIDLIHLDVPQHDYDDVVDGWSKYYWEPWRAYLQR